MTTRGDEVEVAADSGLGGVDVAEVVHTVDDPELPVAGCEVENLLVVRQNDQGREPQFGMHRHDVFTAVLYDSGAGFRRVQGGRRPKQRSHYEEWQQPTRLP